MSILLALQLCEHQSVDGTPQKNTIGMDDYFDRVFGVEAQSYPPYNLVQVNEDESQLEMALAGFTDQEVKVYGEG